MHAWKAKDQLWLAQENLAALRWMHNAMKHYRDGQLKSRWACRWETGVSGAFSHKRVCAVCSVQVRGCLQPTLDYRKRCTKGYHTLSKQICTRSVPEMWICQKTFCRPFACTVSLGPNAAFWCSTQCVMKTEDCQALCKSCWECVGHLKVWSNSLWVPCLPLCAASSEVLVCNVSLARMRQILSFAGWRIEYECVWRRKHVQDRPDIFRICLYRPFSSYLCHICFQQLRHLRYAKMRKLKRPKGTGTTGSCSKL